MERIGIVLASVREDRKGERFARSVEQLSLIAIELNALGSADHLVTGSATFRFTALPAGATVTSCHGYVQASTPAAPATWGRVKAAYR